MRISNPINFIAPPPSTSGGYVYFIQCDDDAGHIKIGHAKNLRHRYDNIQVGCPYPVYVVCFYWHEDPHENEKWLHGEFDADRIRGEWFNASTRLVAFIEELNRRHRDVFTELMKPLAPFEWRGKVRDS